MTGREFFIEKIDELLKDCPDFFGQTKDAEKAIDFFNSMKEGKTTGQMTEKGKTFLSFMQENKDKFNNQFKAADIAEGLGVVPRSVAGSMRKLVNDGYIKKIGEKPNVYSLNLDEEE